MFISKEDAKIIRVWNLDNWYFNRIDFKTQYLAMKEMLQAVKEPTVKFQDDYNSLQKKVESQGGNDFIAEHLNDKGYESQFWDMSYSLAAIGIIAPYIESLFTAMFADYGKYCAPEESEHDRFRNFTKYKWDPHYFAKKSDRVETDIAKGILQLLKCTGFKDGTIAKCKKFIPAIFRYRNLMFHNGVHWPKVKREVFIKEAKGGGWYDWFLFDENSDFVYMGESFIEEILENIIEIVEEYIDIVQPNSKQTTVPAKP